MTVALSDPAGVIAMRRDRVTLRKTLVSCALLAPRVVACRDLPQFASFLPFGDFEFLNVNRGTIDTIDGRVNIRFSRTNLATAGVEFERESFFQSSEPSFNAFNNTTDRQRTFAVFGQDQLSFLEDRLRLSLGVRGRRRRHRLLHSPQRHQTASSRWQRLSRGVTFRTLRRRELQRRGTDAFRRSNIARRAVDQRRRWFRSASRERSRDVWRYVFLHTPATRGRVYGFCSRSARVGPFQRFRESSGRTFPRRGKLCERIAGEGNGSRRVIHIYEQRSRDRVARSATRIRHSKTLVRPDSAAALSIAVVQCRRKSNRIVYRAGV
jgi:hypothetical protein